MPRRNRRDRCRPLDLTADNSLSGLLEPGHIATHLYLSAEERQERFEKRAKDDRERAERQREARIQQGIDWSICLVPQCGRSVNFWELPQGHRDPQVHLPMCDTHAATVWRMVNNQRGNPFLKTAKLDNQVHEAEANKIYERKIVVRQQGGEGVIYFLRHNGLIKVGWTGDFAKRLRAYGPSTEVLCHYPGTRQDETTLHRQLRPSLAKGREWYHEDQLINLFVSDAIKRHGEPVITDGNWTEPARDLTAQPRKRSA